jgi:hypothetical protein
MTALCRNRCVPAVMIAVDNISAISIVALRELQGTHFWKLITHSKLRKATHPLTVVFGGGEVKQFRKICLCSINYFVLSLLLRHLCKTCITRG